MGLPTLAGSKARFESQLADTCTLTHDPTGETNAVLDRNTGEISGGASDAVDSGPFPCLLRASSIRASNVRQNEEELAIAQFDILMRSSDPVPQPGDVLTIESSQLNPNIVGHDFEVLNVDTTSLNFAQVVRTQEVLATQALP